MKSKGADDMKKRPLVLILLLLLLLSLTPKDVMAEDVDESSESITSFSETLAHDQMYYPDDEDCLGWDGYFESYKDISDCVGSAGVSISTDGDVVRAEAAGDNTYRYLFSGGISMASAQNLYLEYRLWGNVTGSFKVYTGTADNGGSLTMVYDYDTFGVVHETWKILITHSNAVECIAFRFKAVSPVSLYVDYTRTGPATEMGYGHDCSTVANTTTLRAYDESDGDHIKFEHLGGGATGEMGFHVDFAGPTVTAIDTDYYPFVGWYAVNLTDDFYCVYADGTLLYNGSGLGLQHTNVKAAGEAEYTTITFVLDTVTESMALDWVKGYSIANFTASGSSLTVSDVMYVDDGRLIMDNAGGCEYSWIENDAEVVVPKATYNVWNITCIQDTDYIRFRELTVSNYWHDLGDTRGAVYSSTLKLFRIYNWADAVSNITLSAVKFIDVRNWEEINDVEIIFQIGWSPEIQFGYDAIFIFLGLIMIPASTMYLAWGGRKAMSADKLFYGLVIFALGFGFLIGGIMP